jgi:eukaryotic-like serine/threonine-protein kinase
MSDTVTLQSSPVGGHHPGDVIAGKYRLEREIGRGAMGTVWAALHTTLGQRVAIKLISAEHAGSVDARHRFSLEAKAAARLRSRHVVQVYDDGETPDGTPYIVMEFLEGETLEERLARQRDMGLPEAVRITSHVGRALARAHAQGIVHRDLKSGNIFIAKTDDDELGWVAKVLDFGVAKLTDSQAPSTTKTGAIVGTPLFMSPEQIRGASQVDHRADLYSLGMVFYNMVTGSHAYDGPSYSDVLVSICTEPLPDLRLTAPWLPKGLGNWFDKACARERELRFQSADEMVDALQEAAGGVRPSALPEEVSGPSGTLMGHVPPHAAATLQVDAFPVSSPASRRAAFAEKGTLRSRHSEPPQTRSTARPARNAHGDLLWWAAAGAGLAVVVMLITTAVTRRAAAPPPPAAAGPVAAPPEPPVVVPPSPSAVPVPPSPPTPKPSASEQTEPTAPSTASVRRPESVPPKRRDPAPPTRAPSVSAPTRAPDMGF